MSTTFTLAEWETLATKPPGFAMERRNGTVVVFTDEDRLAAMTQQATDATEARAEARAAAKERDAAEAGTGERWTMPKRAAATDAVDLLARDIPPLRLAVPGLLPEGLGILAAPPKAGKSLLAYQLAVELTLGHHVLARQVERRPVLYYALEDGERRSQDRVRKALGPDRTLPSGLSLRWDAPRLGSGLEQEVSDYLDANPLGVVIVDVLSKVRPGGISRGNLNAYDEDYSTLSAIQQVAKLHPGSVILFVTHDRKAGSDDFVTRITGTRGVSGAADFLIFIERRRGEMVGMVHVSGRDIADESIGVQFTGSGWQVADTTMLIGATSPTRQTIFRYVEDNGPVWQKAIAEGTGLSENTVRQRVMDMSKDGQLVGGPNGYSVADVDQSSGLWTGS